MLATALSAALFLLAPNAAAASEPVKDPTASVDAASPEALAQARQAYEALDYRRARALLRQVLADERLSDQDRVTANAYMARVLAVLDRPASAIRRFEQVLAMQPEFTISWEESPRIREAFAAAQRNVRKRNAAAATAAGPTPPPARTPARHLQPPSAEEKAPAAEGLSTRTLLLIAGGVGLVIATAASVVFFTRSPDEDPNRMSWDLP